MMDETQTKIEQLKVEMGELAREKNFYKSRLATIEHHLLERRDVFKNDSEFLELLLRLTRRVL